MDKAQQWRSVLEKLGCIKDGTIVAPAGKRLHLYFGTIDVNIRGERPTPFDDVVVQAHDIHFNGDTAYLLWDNMTSISIR